MVRFSVGNCVESVEYPELFHRITYNCTRHNTLDVMIESLGSYNGEDELVLKGGIRFDGCSNWHWGDLSVHWCEWSRLQQLTDTVKKAYIYASEFYGDEWCGTTPDEN